MYVYCICRLVTRAITVARLTDTLPPLAVSSHIIINHHSSLIILVHSLTFAAVHHTNHRHATFHQHRFNTSTTTPLLPTRWYYSQCYFALITIDTISSVVKVIGNSAPPTPPVNNILLSYSTHFDLLYSMQVSTHRRALWCARAHTLDASSFTDLFTGRGVL